MMPQKGKLHGVFGLDLKTLEVYSKMSQWIMVSCGVSFSVGICRDECGSNPQIETYIGNKDSNICKGNQNINK